MCSKPPEMDDECSLSPDISALKEIKLKNVNRLVIGQLNLNGISGKLEPLKSFICKYIDSRKKVSQKPPFHTTYVYGYT